MLRVIVSAFLLFVFACGATAQERVVPINALFCDGAEHVETYLFLLQKGKSGDEAIAEVNKISGGDVCAVVAVFVVPKGPIGAPFILDEVGAVQVYEVLVVGVMTPEGPKPLPKPMQAFVPVIMQEGRS